jgi:hypothetical protein
LAFRLIRRNASVSEAKSCKLNVAENHGVAGKYWVHSIPTLMIVVAAMAAMAHYHRQNSLRLEIRNLT